MKLRAIIAAVLFTSLGALTCCAEGADTNALQFIKSELDLGTLAGGQDFPVTFVMTNRSDKAVKIANVNTSCHCTTVLKSPEEIPAHGSGAVELNFNSSRSDGPVTQSVVVETADKQILAGQFSATVSPVPASSLWLPDRGDGTYQNPVMNADFSDPDAVRVGAMCQFAYNFDNRTFTPVGEPFKAAVDRWIGAKIGVIATAPTEATKTGHADFDWFHVAAKNP